MKQSAVRTRPIALLGFSALTAAAVVLALAGYAGAGFTSLNCRDAGITIQGTAGPDTLQGTTGDDVISARGGGDVVESGPGDDVVCGGPGSDDLSGGADEDTVRGGSDGDDVFAGAGNDESKGGRGDDEITDDSGRDFVSGGPDDDTLDVVDQQAKRRRGFDDAVHCGQGQDAAFVDFGADQPIQHCESITFEGAP